MTIIVGAAYANRDCELYPVNSSLFPLNASGLFAALAAVIQVICFRLSFLPAIAHR